MVKKTMDLLLSFLLIFLFSPVLLLLAIIIKLESKGPIFFKQKRVGKDKTYFYILKFRTMNVDTPKDQATHLLENPEKYITKFGGFLRRTSLDELPQIINILKGEMSFIGPRPALWNQYDLILSRDQNGANTITPGLTGWAQVNGRDEISISAKVEYDGEYAKKLSFLLDTKIFIKTIITVVKSDGIKEGTQEIEVK
jgi:O-antigen biosynthesis protein WbqP